MNTSRRHPWSPAYLRLALAAGIIIGLTGCSGSSLKTVQNTTPPPTVQTGGPSGPATNPLTPGSTVPSLAPFTPSTSASVKNADNLYGSSQFGGNPLSGATILGDVLQGGLFMNPSQQGLALSDETLSNPFTVVSGVLLPTFPNALALSNLGRSNPDVYLGGEVNVSINGSRAEFFARHHDPNPDPAHTRHCLTACRVANDGGILTARIQSDYGGTSTDLGNGPVYLTTPDVIMECVNFKDTIAMYINGRLAVAARDPQPVKRQALFGVTATNGMFKSLSVANLEAVRDSNRIVFFQTDFGLPSGSSLPIQWQITSGFMGIIGGQVVPSGGGTSVAQLRNVDVADIDLSMDYNLSYSSSKAGLVFRSNSSGHYRAEVSFSGNLYQVTLIRNLSGADTVISGPYTVPFKASGRVRVTAHREELRVFVDNQLYAAASDSYGAPSSTLERGSVGMLLNAATGGNFKWSSYY